MDGSGVVELLFDDLEASEFTAYPHDSAQTVDSGHGRIECDKPGLSPILI